MLSIGRFFSGVVLLLSAQCSPPEAGKPSPVMDSTRTQRKPSSPPQPAAHRPIQVKPDTSKLRNFSWELFRSGKKLTTFSFGEEQVFPEPYSLVEGVLTFRGNHMRTAPAFGVCPAAPNKLKLIWTFKTALTSPHAPPEKNWGGGAGWTGQPALIRWPDSIKAVMNLKEKFKSKPDFVEVIQASLDGKVYFLDLETGEQTRSPLDIQNPIKGSVSVDPRGYPLLYVGQGIPESGRIGYRIFSLIDGKLLYFLPGIDTLAPLRWGAFDASGVVNRTTDVFFIAGENGLFYAIKLNTKFSPEKKTISINPEVLKYRYKVKGIRRRGIENSPAFYKNIAYFADNAGVIQALDIQTMTPLWYFLSGDDVDASLAIEVENDTPYVYTGNEVDQQGSEGYSYLRKLNGLTGEVVWECKYKCYSVGTESPINGGLLATPVIGQASIADRVIFALAHAEKKYGGLVVALDKRTGQELWQYKPSKYVWSSPVAVYDSTGAAYLIVCDLAGQVSLLDAQKGTLLSTLSLGYEIEASPAVFGDKLVLGSRGPYIYGIRLQSSPR